MVRSARGRILIGDFQGMLHNLSICILMMQMTVVQVVHVSVMFDRRVATASTMLMIVVLVSCRHEFSLLLEVSCCRSERRSGWYPAHRELVVGLARMVESIREQMSDMTVG